ncbi:unnamed protein product [Urochloa decumbens]|uniref:Dirigent protein n=1 Tax=Urochloa decumbens TaxID=240449 RepID=A0ABC9CBA1_9POAL
MAISSRMLSLFLLILASSSTTPVLASDSGNEDGGLTHIHLYVHETFKGANATTATPIASPLGANSTFGSMAVFDDEIRASAETGPPSSSGGSRASSSAPASTGLPTTCRPSPVVFTAGEYQGSTLSVEGPVLGFKDAIERPVVGGTGKFRMTSGYSLFKVLGNPTPDTVVFELDLFVLIYRG